MSLRKRRRNRRRLMHSDRCWDASDPQLMKSNNKATSLNLAKKLLTMLQRNLSNNPADGTLRLDWRFLFWQQLTSIPLIKTLFSRGFHSAGRRIFSDFATSHPATTFNVRVPSSVVPTQRPPCFILPDFPTYCCWNLVSPWRWCCLTIQRYLSFCASHQTQKRKVLFKCPCESAV